MKTSFSAPAVAGAGALLCAVVLAGCGRPSAPPTAEAAAGGAPAPAAGDPSGAPSDASDPLAAAKRASPTAAETQAAQDVRDNLRARALAVSLAAHPDWLARQDALCGPGDAVLQARYAALAETPPEALRDLKVACLAKDIAERAAGARAGSGGVVDTGSL